MFEMRRFGGLLLILSILLVDGCGRSPAPQDANDNVIRAALGAKVRGLDPGDIGDTISSSVASQIFDCLYQYQYLLRPYELVPCLAEDMPQISPDGLTYTIKIKKGVYFADDACFQNSKGRELIAEDFVYAWKRIANIKYLSKNWWIFDSRIVGLNEFRAYTKTCKTPEEVDYSRNVEGFQTPDHYTIVIKLTKPWPQITYLLAHLPTAPMAKEAVDKYGKDIINHPVGTGPFKLKIFRRDSFVEMVRNPNFRTEYYPSQGEPNDVADGLLADAGKKIPFVNGIIWKVIEESQPMWLLFLQGRIDASGIPKDNFSQAIDPHGVLTPTMEKRKIHLQIFRDPSTYWLGFNMQDPVLGKNKPLRHALRCAIDKKTYINLFTNNRAETAYGFIPPLMKSYDPNIRKFADTDYDPQRAKQLIGDAEKIYGGKLPQLKLAMPGTDTTARQEGQFIERCFKEVGLDVKADYMDWPTFQDRVNNKSAQMFMLGWVADYPDAESFLQLFYSKNISPGSNNFNYSNPEFDTLYKKVSVMPDSPERDKLYQQAQRMIVEDYPAAFLIHGVNYVLLHDWVKNYKSNVFAYGTSKYRRIDLAERAAYGSR
jgi:oligopeptide transport system substrate-binding protein